MAKKNNIDPKSATQARIKRTEAYAERVRLLFAQTVNEILALNKSMPQLDEGEMFSFAGESMKRQKEVERLLRLLHSVATMAIEKGIRLEWSQANDECDKLVKSCFGKRALSSPEFAAWTQRNSAAMNAFIARSENGLNLSQRVWKSVEQLRDEMEVAITVSVGEGESAASMSRKVRQYLNDPDLMFRRFRYKDPESGEWRRKWKKRIKDPATGKVKWIDYDKRTYQDQWTGRGYYKSSAQNAMRVARTETNIAYRRADNERWQQMDFVLGQRVNLSRSHPKKDICDKLAGDYPVDFVFDGWHPQCFCFVTPILMDEDEMAKVSEAFLRGEKYVPRGKRITDYPDNFKQWVSEHKEDIAQSRDRGTEPYFIRNNAIAIDEILDPSLKKLTPQQIAAKRHEARTPEQEDEIRRRWKERSERIEAEKIHSRQVNATANNVLNAAAKRFASFGISTAELEEAIKSGNTALIQQQTKTLALAMSAKQQLIKATAKKVNSVADGYSEVDTTALNEALASGNLEAIHKQTRAIAQSVLAMKKAEQALSAIIPDAHTWHEQFTLAELQQVYAAVESKLANISTLPLYEQVKAIEKEIKWVSDPTYLKPHKQYPTWNVAQDAYMKKLDEVKKQIAVAEAKDAIDKLKVYVASHPKATTVANAVLEAELLLASGGDMLTIKAKIDYAQKRKELQEKAAAQKAVKGSKIGEVTFKELSKKRQKELLDDYKVNTVEGMDDVMRPATEEAWKGLIEEERMLLTKYTQTYSYLNEPLRNMSYCGGRAKDEYDNDMPKITAALSRVKTKQDMVVRRGTSDYYIPEIGKNLSQAEVGDTFIDGAFLSTACHRDKGFGGSINMIILIPKGAQGIFAEPFTHYNAGYYDYQTRIWNGTEKVGLGGEFEWIGQRGSRFKVIRKSGKNLYLMLIGQQFTQPTGMTK
ncbi:ADP-ribosyltransferase [Sangeribacter muris]|uniref:ADP-ribosyltransferase n=1 Tax=Sangeribacter muris TaxID=2880703 RepID=UPI00244DE06E|nr:ADP-ribosyltransferase [Sangeribacter muris]